MIFAVRWSARKRPFARAAAHSAAPASTEKMAGSSLHAVTIASGRYIQPYRPLASSLFVDIRLVVAPPYFACCARLPERESRRRLLPSAFIHCVKFRLQHV
ncbi:hypothetical protein [Paraburkholderia sp. JPY419]|uniref:hypothetical protein n=1 Tax=Paraburkholderia sp. JPY419 TaxID=667660 RepID=UPI003D1D2E10